MINVESRVNQTIYLRDVIERFKLRDVTAIEAISDIAMSNIGCLTNPTRLSALLNASDKITTNNVTVSHYLGFLESAFLIRNVRLFDLRGNRYLDYPSKYYAVDTGIRNSRLNFRQDENTHLMENAIYSEMVRKREQETFSLRHIGNNFRKVVVTGNPYEKPWTDKSDITFIGIMPFLLDPKSLETL